MLASKERASDLERLIPLIEAGQVTPSIDRTYPLDRVPEAMRHLEAGDVRGKGRHHHLTSTRGATMHHDPTGPMAGRTVLITGGTGGIGRATAVGLARMGARVAIIGRDRTRAFDAARGIEAAGSGAVDVFVADLSSQARVRQVAAEALDRLDRIDVLVNNVGGYWHTRHVTADGLEQTFALNHLAPFLLTNLLLDRLEASDRPGW